MIKLSRLTDYAFTLLTQMVGGDKAMWAASDLAERTGLPLPTVSKVLKQLAKSQIVQAQRGAAGGYSLVKKAHEISVAMVVEAMDGPIALTECTESGDHNCSVESVCAMRSKWSKINRAVRHALETVSLADMQSPAFPPALRVIQVLDKQGIEA
ncbi:MAG: SUF system Fe-S cluster assembly regulator [Bdellovibrionales bacterium]